MVGQAFFVPSKTVRDKNQFLDYLGFEPVLAAGVWQDARELRAVLEEAFAHSELFSVLNRVEVL